MAYRAEYIWSDGTEPTPILRSKTKIIADGEEPGIWGFDGSSTNQAPGSASDCVLRPVFVCDDPIRGGADKIVLCEVLLTDFTPHPTNTRAECAAMADKYADMADAGRPVTEAEIRRDAKLFFEGNFSQFLAG